jgi:vancomycin permeability regulator SanA
MTARGEEFSATNVPKHDVAIVFGAGVYPDGTPTPFLQSRLLAAIQLYKDGKVRVLLMSGDNRTSHYDEPTVMKKFAVAHGVPARAVVLDYAGYNTYDTCYRVHYLFGVNSAILVTHGYHLPRALLTCNSLDIKSVGVKADRANSSFSKNYLLREVLSTNKAVIQLIFKFKPGVLGPKLNAVTTASSPGN